MTSMKLVAVIDELLTHLDETTELRSALDVFAGGGAKVMKKVQEIADEPNGNSVVGKVNEARQISEETSAAYRKLHSRKIHRAADELELAYRHFYGAFLGTLPEEFADGIQGPAQPGPLGQLEHFINDLEMVKHRTHQATTAAMASAKALNATLSFDREAFKMIRDALIPKVKPDKPDTQRLSLSFTDVTTLDAMGRKLIHLEKLYNLICQILNVGVAEYPIEVIKIESGTWNIDISGTAAVILVIIGAIKFFYVRMTPAAIAREKISINKEALFSSVDILNVMRASGLDTTTVQEKVESLGEQVVESMSEIVQSQSIKLNGESMERPPLPQLASPKPPTNGGIPQLEGGRKIDFDSLPE